MTSHGHATDTLPINAASAASGNVASSRSKPGAGKAANSATPTTNLAARRRRRMCGDANTSPPVP